MADGDDADSDSTTSGSSADLVGKANGAGGEAIANAKSVAKQNGNVASSNGAFDTSAFSKKFSAKRPPGGKVCGLHRRVADAPIDMLCMQCQHVSFSPLLQLSKKQLMERAKEEKRKSATGDKGKSSAKVTHMNLRLHAQPGSMALLPHPLPA